MAKNEEMIRQATSAVNIRVKSPEYNNTDAGSPVYDVVTIHLKVQLAQELTELGNTSPWLADNQSCDLNNEFWLVVYWLINSPSLC